MDRHKLQTEESPWEVFQSAKHYQAVWCRGLRRSWRAACPSTIGCQWSTIAEILKSITASDIACHYLGRRAEALSLYLSPMPVSYLSFWNFGSQPLSDMSLCQCYHTSDPDRALTLFRVPMYYIFVPSSCRIAMRLLRECDAHEEVSQLSFYSGSPVLATLWTGRV